MQSEDDLSSRDRRKLSAIVFTDIFGYSALVQSNESKTLRELDHHNRIIRASLKKHDGREVKTVGDSFLLEFESALDATLCAISIQRAMLEQHPVTQGGDGDSLPPLKVRIGIHLGDVVHRGSDVLGDTVNIASRIEQLAEPGGICVSEQVYSQIRNKLDYTFEKLGPVELKNIQFGVPVYRLILPEPAATSLGAEASESSERRIAVLPFVNMSPSREDEYFAEGLTEELITRLALLKGLKVISRTSVMHYKNSGKGISEIARELKVENILEGSVRKSGSRIRITAQLIDCSTEDHLWTERFDLELNDIFEVQDSIAMKVVDALRSRFYLVPTEEARRNPTENVQAYTLYLRGRFLWNKRDREPVNAALGFFRQAIDLDPKFARAYSGIADCYSVLANHGTLPPKEIEPKAREACAIALKLDDQLAEAHASQGLILFHSFDYAAAEKEFKRAIQLNPSYASAHQWYATLLLALGRSSEGLKEFKIAEESDPVSYVILANLAFNQWICGDKSGALETLEKAIRLDATNPRVYLARANLLAMESRREETLRDLRMFETLAPDDDPMKKAHVAEIYAELGDTSMAEKVVEELVEMSQEGTYIPPPMIAALYNYVGDLEQAFAWSFKSIDDASIEPVSLRYDPTLEGMRADPRFKKLMEACNLE